MKNLILTVLVIGMAGCSSSSRSNSPASGPAPLPSAQESPTIKTERTLSIDMNAENQALAEMHQKIEVQRQAISQEKAELDAAIAKRDNKVHFGKDLMDTLAYGVSSSALTYDFVTKTNSVEKVKKFFNARNIPTLAPVESSTSTAMTVVPKAKWLKSAGSALFRSSELVSAAVLGAFFIGDVYNTGNDVVVWFDSTEQIREQRMRLGLAEKSLEIAEQNLQTAIESNKETQYDQAPVFQRQGPVLRPIPVPATPPSK
jgi:hypothetical protein